MLLVFPAKCIQIPATCCLSAMFEAGFGPSSNPLPHCSLPLIPLFCRARLLSSLSFLTHSPLPCVKTTRYTFFKKFLAHLTFFVLLFYDPLYYTLSRECTLTCPVLFLLLILTFLTKKCVFLKAHSLLTTLLL